MSNYENARAQIQLAKEIVSGKLHSHHVQKRLGAMKETYTKPFSSYIPTRKEKPWDVAYLKSLSEVIPFGGGSEAQFLYMAEVADEVYRRIRLVKRCVIAVALLAGLIAIVVAAINLLGKGN